MVAKRSLGQGEQSAYSPPDRKTLVSAPAVFGKTSLLSEWASGRVSESASGRPAAWLSLDEGANDLARLLAYFVAAPTPVIHWPN
ncbi:MAG: hypothetical protein SXV54_03165 [Chloroflexota bacterium]|nr:hypothetical protein [Chloroflexota bacterium]